MADTIYYIAVSIFAIILLAHGAIFTWKVYRDRKDSVLQERMMDTILKTLLENKGRR